MALDDLGRFVSDNAPQTHTNTHVNAHVRTRLADMLNRLAVFHAAGLLIGINLGPLLAQVAFNRPDLIITALTGCKSI